MKQKKTSKAPWWILTVLLLAAAAVLVVYILRHSGIIGKPVAEVKNTGGRYEQLVEPSFAPTEVEKAEGSVSAPVTAADLPTASEGTEQAAEDDISAAYESPVDFEAAWSVNEDIIGWLYIPGISLSYPVLQHPTDNTYYLTHTAEKKSSSSGAIFIEDYNQADFSDACTIVYGHRMYDGDMFGILQANYSSLENLRKNAEIRMYFPDREVTYQAFAAVPYDNTHILVYNDFDDQLSYESFINNIYYSTGVNVALDSDAKPQYGDRLLILSTCLWGDRDTRYLVLAKELDG